MMVMKSKKMVIGSLGALIIVAGITGAYFFLYNRSDSKGKEGFANLCVTDSIGKKIGGDTSVLKAENTSKLKPITDDILKINDYDKSPTCMYVLTMYDINSNNLDTAKVSYEKLLVVFKQGTVYGANIVAVAHPAKDLKVLIDGIEARKKEFEKQVFLVPAGLPE
jgi:hypothetical protein